MNWHRSPLVGLKTQIDWAAPGMLDKIDPYLVWFDLSGFVGAQLQDGNAVQCLVELPDYGETKIYRTETHRFDQIPALLERMQTKAINRFELATPTLVGSAVGTSITTVGGSARQTGKTMRAATEQPSLVGFIDYGCAFAHRQFRQWHAGAPTLNTRVVALWDQACSAPAPMASGFVQSLAWQCPADFGYGAETLRDGPPPPSGLRLNDYIAQFRRAGGSIDDERCYAQSGYHAATRPSTHGTHIMDVATGHPSPLAALPGEAAHVDTPHGADIVFVQLPRWIRGRQVGGMLRTHVLDALHYILSLAKPQTRVVVNLSYGTYCGPHDGSSMLEEAIDALIAAREPPGKLDVVVAAGNAYDKELHAFASIASGEQACFAWHNLPDDPSDSFVELWLPAAPLQVAVRVRPPGFQGEAAWLLPGQAAALRRDDGSLVAALVHANTTCQGRHGRMVLLAVASTAAGTGRPPAPYGSWQIEVDNTSSATVEVNAWCERDDLGYGGEPWPRQGYFSNQTDRQVLGSNTLSSLAHGKRTTVVGATLINGPVAAYSSTGPEQGQPGRRPDALAPADESVALPGLAAAAVIGGSTVRLNGTSVAAAYVTRLMLEGRYPTITVGKGPPGPALSAHPDDNRVPRLPRLP